MPVAVEAETLPTLDLRRFNGPCVGALAVSWKTCGKPPEAWASSISSATASKTASFRTR